MKLDYEHAKYMWQVMKEFKRKPLEQKDKDAKRTNSTYEEL